MSKEKLVTNLAIVYFVIGLLFATSFAVYYKWSPLSFLSPGFFAVVFTWPLQAIGFVGDLLTYGLAGKPI
ncbi:hypothetical protein HYZ06_02575 [Candidatus Daviesbacteria bacterium]|nr:hypothetical protein [Candidatus Daviesbacteria bacterium]